MITTVIIYLLISFIKLDIFWVKDVVNYSEHGRGLMVTLFLSKIIFEQLILDTIKTLKK